MRAPRVGQEVRVDGLNGRFTVARVYPHFGTADLELTTCPQKTRMHLPIRMMHLVGIDKAGEWDTEADKASYHIDPKRHNADLLVGTQAQSLLRFPVGIVR